MLVWARKARVAQKRQLVMHVSDDPANAFVAFECRTLHIAQVDALNLLKL